MAHAAGAELADLELCQFHPTALAAPGDQVRRAAGHRGGPRRGRHPARRRRRALHRRARAARRGHRGDPRPDGARRHRPRPARPARASREARFPNVFEALREAGFDPARGAGPGGARLPLRDGRDRDRPRGPLLPAGPVRGRRVRLHRPARRQPPRLELAHASASCSAPRAARRGEPRPRSRRRGRRCRAVPASWRFDAADRRDPRGGLARWPARCGAPSGLERLLDDPYPLARLIARFALERAESRGSHQRDRVPRSRPRARRRHLSSRRRRLRLARRWA